LIIDYCLLIIEKTQKATTDEHGLTLITQISGLFFKLTGIVVLGSVWFERREK